MSERAPHEALFLTHLPEIERLLAFAQRSAGLRGDDAEEFASWARERLWDDDCAILRKWRGESAMRTYLRVVVAQLAHEFRVKHWGRWRPSAEALRRGAVAVALERLVARDGLSLAEAGELLRTRGETTESDRALGELLRALPRRARPRRADDEATPIELVAGGAAADDAVRDAELDAERAAVLGALRDAVAALAPEQQVVIRMGLLGRSLADTARALGVEQKPLYRVRDGARTRLRAALEARGFDWVRVRDIFGAALPDDETPDDTESGEAGGR